MPRFHVWAALAIALFLGAADASAGPRDASSPGGEPRLVRVLLGADQTISTLLVAGLDVVDATGSARPRSSPGLATRHARPARLAPSPRRAPGRTAARRTQAELDLRPAPVLKRVRSAVRPDGIFRIEDFPPSARAAWAATGPRPRSR